MKNNFHLQKIIIVGFLCFVALAALGQTDVLITKTFFLKTSLLGSEFKVLSQKELLRFELTAETGRLFPHQKGNEFFNGGGIDSLSQMIFSDPNLFEKLFESLGGEFFIGSLSAPPAFEKFKQKNGQYYGISGAYRFNDHLQAKLRFAFYKTKITARFPIVVFDPMTYEPFSAKGKLSTELKSMVFQITANYFPFTGIVQPFVGTGAGFTATNSSMTEAEIGDVVFDVSKKTAKNSIGFVFKAGIAVAIQQNIFLQIEGQLFSVAAPDDSGAAWNKSLSGGVGVRF